MTEASPPHIDSPEAIARDVAAIGNIGAVPSRPETAPRVRAADGGRVRALCRAGEISVANGGEPIAQALQGKVFEPYWRPATSAPGGGLGLGLCICSQIVKAHGSGLGVTSSAEKGTRFVAQLPVKPGAAS